MDQKIENITLKMHIDQLCELYEKREIFDSNSKNKKTIKQI